MFQAGHESVLKDLWTLGFALVKVVAGVFPKGSIRKTGRNPWGLLFGENRSNCGLTAHSALYPRMYPRTFQMAYLSVLIPLDTHL
jgi:hypothetical protein